MSKKSFFARLFSGTTIEAPQTDATGAVTFSAEQYAALDAHLGGWETALEGAKAQKEAVEGLTNRLAMLEEAILKADGIMKKHSEQFAKLAVTPAVAPVASTVEPVSVLSGPDDIDPIDAQLNAMRRK